MWLSASPAIRPSVIVDELQNADVLFQVDQVDGWTMKTIRCFIHLVVNPAHLLQAVEPRLHGVGTHAHGMTEKRPIFAALAAILAQAIEGFSHLLIERAQSLERGQIGP